MKNIKLSQQTDTTLVGTDEGWFVKVWGRDPDKKGARNKNVSVSEKLQYVSKTKMVGSGPSKTGKSLPDFTQCKENLDEAVGSFGIFSN